MKPTRCTRLVLAVLLPGLFAACSGLLGPEITDDNIRQYLQARKSLDAKYPDAGKNADALTAEQKADMDALARAAGFENHAAYSALHTKLTLAYTVVEARQFVSQLEETKNKNLAEIEQKLNSPALPAETRAQLEASKKTIENQATQAKQTAQAVLGAASLAVDDKSAAAVQRHLAALRPLFLDSLKELGQP